MEKVNNWIGFDVAKEKMDVAFFSGSGPFESEAPRNEFPRTVNGVKECFQWVMAVMEARGLQHTPLRAVMDATGRYSLEITAWLLQYCPELRPSIVNPMLLSNYARSLGLRNKTDPLDALTHARYGYERQPKPYEPPEAIYQELKELVRQRFAINTELVAARNRQNETTSIKSVQRIRKSHVQHLEKLIDRLEKNMKAVVNTSSQLRKDVDLLMTIPGVGFLAAITILGELGDLRRFNTSRQISAFSGLSPRNYQSGNSVKKARISRNGSPFLRGLLYMPAMATTRGDCEIAKAYHRLVAGGMVKKAALCAVIRKIIVVIRALIINQVPYEKNYKSNPLAKKSFPVENRLTSCGKKAGKIDFYT